MAAPVKPQVHRRKKRRRRTQAAPPYGLILLILAIAGGLGVYYGVRRMPRVHRAVTARNLPTSYIGDPNVFTSEYVRYYGKELDDRKIVPQFRTAAERAATADFPSGASVLENVVKFYPLPVVFHDLGILYTQLNDHPRAVECFREVLARDPEYPAARAFLKQSKAFTPNETDPLTREVEPNNDHFIANLIPVNTPIQGEIGAGTADNDYFRLAAPASPRDLIEVQVTSHSFKFTPRVHVYDEKMKLLDWVEKPATQNGFVIQGSPAPNSAIYLDVFGGNDTGGVYSLLVKPLKAFDAYEPNDDIMRAHKVSVGETIEANIMDPADTDFYSFVSPRKGTVSIDIHNRSTTLMPGLTTFTPDRHNSGFGEEVRVPGTHLHHTMEVEKDKMYYIQVWSQASSSGAYSLRLE